MEALNKIHDFNQASFVFTAEQTKAKLTRIQEEMSQLVRNLKSLHE
jgi:hypothetical protein